MLDTLLKQVHQMRACPDILNNSGDLQYIFREVRLCSWSERNDTGQSSFALSARHGLAHPFHRGCERRQLSYLEAGCVQVVRVEEQDVDGRTALSACGNRNERTAQLLICKHRPPRTCWHDNKPLGNREKPRAPKSFWPSRTATGYFRLSLPCRTRTGIWGCLSTNRKF